MTAVPYSLTPPRVQMGLVVLQADQTLEADARRLLPEKAEMLVTRVRSAPHVTSASLSAMAGDLGQAIGLFPQAAEFSVIGYGCTSGAAEIGPEHIRALIGARAAAVTEPVSALVAACAALGVTRLGLISPYIAQVSQRLVDVLAKHGIQVTAFASFEESEEQRVVRIDNRSLRDAAQNLADQKGMEALFLSCTNLRTLDCITDLEQATGLPVLSSNLVLLWHMLHLSRQAPSPNAPGQLWQAAG